MTPEKLFHELLGLGLNWEMAESRFERESGTIFLDIRETAQVWDLTRCPQDGGWVFCYDHTEVLGETDTRSWRMLFRQVDAAYAEADFSNVWCVGVDEMHVRKGYEYMSVFADLAARRVLFATEGTDLETWARFREALEKHNRHRHAITQASMDMSPTYELAVRRYCRNAQVVFDKFHVIQNANRSCSFSLPSSFTHLTI